MKESINIKMTKMAVILILSTTVLFAEDIAVFPPQDTNVDSIFISTFSNLLAKNYAKVSGLKVISPLQAGTAIPADSNYDQAAAKLGVSEYLETKAVCLKAPSNNQEKKQKVTVTVSRRDKNGSEIYKVEISLTANDDIEGTSYRVAEALFKKIPMERIPGTKDSVHEEKKGNEFERRNVIKIGGIFPYGWNPTSLSPMISIGYEMRFDAERYFIVMGAGVKYPITGAASIDSVDSSATSPQSYGSVILDVGIDYYLIPGDVAWFLGGGMIPGICFTNLTTKHVTPSFTVAPYLQTGVMFPIKSHVVLIELRVAQHILPIRINYTSPARTGKLWPLEASINLGDCF